MLLIPVFLGVIAFVLCLFNGSYDFCTMNNLSGTWSYSLNNFSDLRSSNLAAAGAMSSAPIYLGLMAIAGVLLIKDSFKYLFMKSK